MKNFFKIGMLLFGILILLFACKDKSNEPLTVLLNKSEITLTVGDAETLIATISPEGSNASVTWSSDNTAVANVDNGKVTAIAKGETTIYAQAEASMASCKVTVVDVAVTGITLDEEELSLLTGDAVQLTATIKPEAAAEINIVWSSENESVATVKDGLVAAVAIGETTITATAGGFSATCKVTVSERYEVITDLKISGYGDKTIIVTFQGGQTMTVTLDADGAAQIGGASNAVIRSIQTENGPEILIGRLLGDSVEIATDDTGNIKFRPMDNIGLIPVGTYSELALIGRDVATRQGEYKQEADIDLMNIAWSPIGDFVINQSFVGFYDGGGYKIKNIMIDTPATETDTGLFGSARNASFENITLESGSITGNIFVGAICGCAINSTITFCKNLGVSVSGEDGVGGICGDIEKTVMSVCENRGEVKGTYRVGGLTGYTFTNSVLAASANYGNVQGSEEVGGVTGQIRTGTVTGCINRGSVTGVSPVGGVVGQINRDGEAKGSYSLGKLEGESYIGGVVGYILKGTVTDCYWSGYNGNGIGVVEEGSGNATYFKDGTTTPSGSVVDWPAEDPSKGWGIFVNYQSTLPVNGYSWKSLGTSGTTGYPELYWQED